MRSGWLRRKHHVVRSQLIDQSVCRDGRGCRIGVGWKPVRVDVKVLGIKQQRSHCTLWRPRIGRTPVIQQLVTRDLDEATVAAARAAPGEDGPGESRLAVRP